MPQKTVPRGGTTHSSGNKRRATTKLVAIRPVVVKLENWEAAERKALREIERSERLTHKDLGVRINA